MKYEKLLPKSLFHYILIPMTAMAIAISLTAIAILAPILRTTFESRVISDLFHEAIMSNNSGLQWRIF